MKVQMLSKIRQYHNYVGLFFAPAIFFFAISGALQTFRLQEEKGYGGPPPNWIVVMAELHKDQMLPKVDRAAEFNSDTAKHKPAKVEKKAIAAAPDSSRFLLQIFSVLMAFGLVISSSLGIAIALSNRVVRKRSVWLLIAGLIVPTIPLLL